MKAKIKALLFQIESGKMDNDKVRILNYLMMHDSNIIRLGQALQMKHQTLTARLSDLMDLGVIDSIRLTNLNGLSYSMYFYQKNEEVQEINAYNRKLERYHKWLKKGDEFKNFVVK